MENDRKPGFIGGWWRRKVRLLPSETVLKEGRSEYEAYPPLRLGRWLRWLPLPGAWFSGRLFLTDQRLVWSPSILEFFVRPMTIKLADIREVGAPRKSATYATTDWFVRTDTTTYRFDPGIDFLHGPDANEWLQLLKALRVTDHPVQRTNIP